MESPVDMTRCVKRLAPILLASLMLGGCASNIPELIRQAPPGDIQVEEAQQRPEDFLNSRVRWGGSIVGVENLAEMTYVEVLSRRLSSNGKPEADSSRGRFKMALEGFREPQGFPKDRLITVSGTLVEVAEGMVGDFNYPYPIVAPDSYYIWAVERTYYPYPYYYDPFYYPWHYPYWWYGHRPYYYRYH